MKPLVLSWRTDGVARRSSLLHGARVRVIPATFRLLRPARPFEPDTLSSASGTRFSLVPSHLGNIFIALLCANYVTHHFGKGIIPARCCLTVHDILAAGSDSKQSTKQAELPVPPHPVSTGNGAFREYRQNGVIFGQTYGKIEYRRDI